MARHKVHERRVAREGALALLYSSDITEQAVAQIVDAGAYPADDVNLPEYAEELILGVSEHREDIDAQLEAISENWALDRMPVVDRAVLRLAAYEMIYVDDVPVSVSINEAVELAKAYGGEDDSSRFVNGVLGRLARVLEGEAVEQSGGEAVSEAEPEAVPAGEPAPVPAAESEAVLDPASTLDETPVEGGEDAE